MSDWIGLAFLLLLVVGVLVGIKMIATPKKRTADDFERGASENPSFTGALLNALHDVTDPGAARAKEVRMQMKDGTYRKKKREGKAEGDADEIEEMTND